MRWRRVLVGLGALVVAGAACGKAPAVDCTPPPAVLSCPDGGGPSFAAQVYPQVFATVCANCHAPGGVEASTPLTNYQQIYGSHGSEAQEIFNQVFESCLMPPSDAPQPLTAAERQTLLDWFACGALDSPAPDAGPRD